MGVSVLTTCTMHIPGAHRDKRGKKGIGSFGIGVKMVMSHYVGAWSRTRVLCKSSRCFRPLKHFSSHSSVGMQQPVSVPCSKFPGTHSASSGFLL